MIIYDKRFLAWWGILLFVCKLGSRRQLDFQLRQGGPCVLDNVNRLAQTAQVTLPCHDTLDHFLSHVGAHELATLRRKMLWRLLRMRALEGSRLLGRYVVALDGTGVITFRRQHCTRCLRVKSGGGMLYLHPVLEAKLVTPEGLALSMGSEFIENPPCGDEADPLTWQTIKQDCELKALPRLAEAIARDFPQRRLCITADALYACGTAIQTVRDNSWDFVFTFKEGSMPAVWHDFQSLLTLCPQNTLRLEPPDGTVQIYRWVNGIRYCDDQGREHTFDALKCREIRDGQEKVFAWITSLQVTRHTVAAIAMKGGRSRWTIENQGFNTQKHGGYNLEHAYAWAPERFKAYYYLVQIAQMILQWVEKGSLLKTLAGRYGKTVIKFFGSLLNIARRLTECLRYAVIPAPAYDPALARRMQIRLDSS